MSEEKIEVKRVVRGEEGNENSGESHRNSNLAQANQEDVVNPSVGSAELEYAFARPA